MEFGVLAPVLSGILLPMVDVGVGIYMKMQVQEAAEAGAQWALLNGFDASAIQSAVTSSTSVPSLAATPAPTKTYGCQNGTTISAASQGATCPNGAKAGAYVTVKAQGTYSPIFLNTVLGTTVTLTGQSTVRIQ